MVRIGALLVTLAACTKAAAPPEPAPVAPPVQPVAQQQPDLRPRVIVTGPRGDIAVAVEVVDTDPLIEKGLMYRQHLPLDSGMLFMMGREHQWSFWMRNTLIPLDMIFIAKDMTIAGIVENAQPLTEELRKVDKPSFYVLEVNGGFTRKAGIEAGAKVRFENMPQ